MSEAAPPEGPVGVWRGHLAVFAAYCALWVLVSWPLASWSVLSGQRLATRHFDLYPSIWLVNTAPSAFPDMVSRSSGWPLNELLSRADSWVLMGLGWLNMGILPGATVCALVALFGVPISAFVGERCAGDGFGVSRPWSLIAGLIYGFSGVTATAMLEGHVYHLLNPWLPMLWWCWQRAGRSDGLRSGLLIGLAFAGALYTTAYFGVFALALLVMLSVESPKIAERVAPGVAAIALPAGIYYLWAFSLSSRFVDTDATSAAYFLRMGTVSASQLLGWDPGADLVSHSLTAALPMIGIPLAIGAIAAVRRQRLLHLGVALLGIALVLGRTWRWDSADAGFDLPVDLFLFGQLAYFRFPIRALWLVTLLIGVLAARTLAVLCVRAPRLAWGALLLAVMDAVISPGLPWRLGSPLATAPSAYLSAPEGRAVLDLWAQPADRSSGEIEMWARNLSCYYAGLHKRPTPEVCIGTGVRSPREVLDAWLTQELLAGRGEAAVNILAEMGVGAVVVHRDVYRATDAASLIVGLTELCGEPVISDDGGERIALFVLPEGDGDARALYKTIVAKAR